MAQEAVAVETILVVEQEDRNDALTTCKKCGHIVPKTMLCLYCGSPILFKMPSRD